jgi:hypothetical protein
MQAILALFSPEDSRSRPMDCTATVPAIEEYFGADVDFAQLVKLYGTADGEGPDWYKPSQVTATIPIPISGNPNPRYISTSHVERANLSIRTHLRRFTRLSLEFSKSLDHLKAAVHLYMAFFNFCRVHQSVRVTPAMQAGLTDHIWTIEKLLTTSSGAKCQNHHSEKVSTRYSGLG